MSLWKALRRLLMLWGSTLKTYSNGRIMKNEILHIHGDNIVECERALELIKLALKDRIVGVKLTTSSVACPQYELKLSSPSSFLNIVFFPGFGRWDHNILDTIRQRGGVLREAADIVVTSVNKGSETPLFAIEFCGALPAGNQAWQRSGRAYSFGKSKIPYLYISELGGFELNPKRERKAARQPNPAVPFSYLAFSMEQDTPVFPIFVTAPGADDISREYYSQEFAEEELIELVRIMLNDADDTVVFAALQKKVLSFVKKRAEQGRGKNTLSSDQWQSAFDIIDNGHSLSEYLTGTVKMPWSKTAYIDGLTANAKNIMAIGKKYGVGLTASNLPMCIVPASKRINFCKEVTATVPTISSTFRSWLNTEEDLAICWVMGFKPKGDDARPDRGLPPLARMLVGKDAQMMTFIYGPAPASTWTALETKPAELALKNGLWEAIFETSDAILAESVTQTNGAQAFLSDHWQGGPKPSVVKNEFLVSPTPLKLGENDVDTAIHLLLSKIMDESIFEGMCNPPGGDWSGVSILGEKAKIEYRWLSLPRVSATGAKRPDHVFQLFGSFPKPIILSVESKETARSLEGGIGPRLNEYLAFLMASGASISRTRNTNGWRISDVVVDASQFTFASAGAYLGGTDKQIADALSRSKTDFTFVVRFEDAGQNCQMVLWSQTDIGAEICNFILSQPRPENFISLQHQIFKN